MNDMTLYWIWLQLCLGCGAKVEECVAYFGDPKSIYDASDYERKISASFTPEQLKKLSTKTLEDARKVLVECEEIGCGIVTPDETKYPQALKCMPNYPLVLYTMGDIGCLKNKLAISIVGTRRASDAGLDIAGKLSASLCRAGVVVVSGGALGIDSAAHLGAVKAGGSTVAVLGCGFNANYHDGIEIIRDDIIEKGAVISEYHPSVGARSYHFPIRNRIIATLSVGTVVVEAALRSGSLITSNIASEYGRDIFAVPGNAANLIQLGTIELIRDGATPVFSAVDILGNYSSTHRELIDWDKVERDLTHEKKDSINFSKIKYEVKNGKVQKKRETNKVEKQSSATSETIEESKEKKYNTDNLSNEEKAVFEAIAQGAKNSDLIMEKTQLPVNEILVALTMLEISGIIKCLPGHIYEIK